METTYLTKNDYTKIFYFISKITETRDNYQFKVLYLLDQIFGFKYTTFNLIDNSTLNLFCPIVNNITDIAIKQYFQYYFKTDIFRPHSNLDLLLKRSVLSINDIMPFSEYEKTEYYIDFLKKDMFYYQLTLPLKYSNQLLGGIGVFKLKGEKNFTKKEMSILSILNKFISDELFKFLWIQDIKKEYQTYISCINETPSGILILNKDYSLVYSNKIAKRIFQEIYPSEKMENSVKKLFFELCSKITLDLNISTSSSSLSFNHKSYLFHISSTAISSVYNGIEIIYIIYITKNKTNKPEISTHHNKFNLTSREKEIIHLLKQGFTNQEIAQKLYISKHTVKSHMENIFKKLKVKNRTGVLHKINLDN